MRSQRRNAKAGTLSEVRKAALDIIGFDWCLRKPKQYYVVENKNMDDVEWFSVFQRLRAFKRTYSHCNVPVDFNPDQKLANWLRYQKKEYFSGKLSDERSAALSIIGCDLRSPKNEGEAPNLSKCDDKWLAMFEKLKAYKEEYGHCRVPSRYKPDYESVRLGNWVGNQRRAYNENKLSEEYTAALEMLGFEWKIRKGRPKQKSAQEANNVADGSDNSDDRQWSSVFQRLKAFVRSHGHCNVPYQFEPDQQLGNWVCHQRRAYWDGKLDSERKAALDALGFDWAFNSERENEIKDSVALGDRDDLWNAMLKKLKAYQKKHGHCMVPRRSTTNPKLGRWVEVQRRKYREGNICPERRAALDLLGFDGGIQQGLSWNSWVKKLKTFKRKHGHCCVPYNYRSDPTLGNWVKRQRDTYFRERLSDERMKVLNSLGFVWDPSGRRSLSEDK